MDKRNNVLATWRISSLRKNNYPPPFAIGWHEDLSLSIITRTQAARVLSEGFFLSIRETFRCFPLFLKKIENEQESDGASHLRLGHHGPCHLGNLSYKNDVG